MARDGVAGGLNAVVSAGLRGGDVAVITIGDGPISAELPVCAAAEVPLAVVDFSVVLVTTNTGVPVPEVTVSALIKGDGFFLVLDCCAPLADTRVPALVPGTGK